MAENIHRKKLFEKIFRFCSDLMNLVKNTEMYTETHPLSKDALTKSLESTRNFLGQDMDISIFISEDSIVFGDFRITSSMYARYPVFSRFHTLMQGNRISVLSIDANIDADALLTLGKGLSIAPAVDIEKVEVDTILAEKGISSVNISISLDEFQGETDDSLLLTHFLDGSLGRELNQDLREKLYLELTGAPGSAATQIQDKLRREEAHNHPITKRDLLTTHGEKWIHILGYIIEVLLGREGFESGNPRILDIIEDMVPVILKLSAVRRGEDVDSFLDKLRELDEDAKIQLFYEYWNSREQHLSSLAWLLEQVSVFTERLINISSSQEIDEDELIAEFEKIMPEILAFPTINEKLFSVINRLPNKTLVFEALNASTVAYVDRENPPREVAAALENRLLRFCGENSSACFRMTIHLVKLIVDKDTPHVTLSLGKIVTHIVNNNCPACAYMEDCQLLTYIGSQVDPHQKTPETLKFLVSTWRESAGALLSRDPDEFHRKLAPMAEEEMNPENFDEPILHRQVMDAWKSFADRPYFQDIFNNIVDSNRELRFKTIERLSAFGPVAVLICMGGLDSQNWYLRRNLATVIGQVIDLNQTNILREPLKDPDWHVRLEIISALAKRVEEVADKLREIPNHPLTKILSMALRDGNKQIRNEACKPIEELKLLHALRSLKELYWRLAAVNADADLDERIQIMKLTAELASAEDAPVEDIVEFLGKIGGQKEGLLTPNWMIPIKKGSVQALASIEHPFAQEWLSTLAYEKPHKRGVVGREARSILTKQKSD